MPRSSYVLMVGAVITPLLLKVGNTCDGRQVNSGSPAFNEAKVSNHKMLLYEETFEGPYPFATAHSKEIGTDHSLSFVTEFAYQGKKSARFELRDSDPTVKNGKRAEVTIVKDVVAKEMWYSFAVYFPSEGYAIDNEAAEIISQWKHLSDDGGGSPSTALRVKADRFILYTGYNEKYGATEVYKESNLKIDLGPVVKNTWHEFVFHIIHSYQSDGLIEAWHNGNKVLLHKGGNYYNVASLPKWKIGIYKSAFKYPGTSDVDRRVLYFDNIRVGSKHVSLTDMVSKSESQTNALPGYEP